MTCILNLGGTYLVAALRARGHRVFSAGLDRGCDMFLKHPLPARTLLARLEADGVRPDAALYADNGNLPFVIGMESLPFPSMFYSIDTFCNPWHVPFAAAFDLVFVAQKDYVPLFRREGYESRWLPLFFTRRPDCGAQDPALFARRDVPVAFVGTLRPRNIPDRLPFLQRFRKAHPLVFMQGDYAPLFSRARIVLNQTAASEVNFRCFEAMSFGAALLMEQCANGLEELFTPGETILPVYPRGDAGAAAAIAEQWLARPDRLAAVARAGQELVLERHGPDQRAGEVADAAANLVAGRAHLARIQDMTRRRHIVSTAYGIIGAELVDPEKARLREFFLALHADHAPDRTV